MLTEKDSNRPPGGPETPHLLTGCINSSVLETFLDAENIVFLMASRELRATWLFADFGIFLLPATRGVKLLDDPPSSRAVFLVIAGAFVHDRRPTITPDCIFVIAGLIGKRSESSASGQTKSDCFLPDRCIQRLRSLSTNQILGNFHSHFMFTNISINPSSEFRSKIKLEVEILVVHIRRTFLVNLDANERYSFRFGSHIWFLNGANSGHVRSEASYPRISIF